ncbi:GNAT family N-acetyltransferase [Nocardioides marmorisolisilvae]|uniref:N-acetyltransferase n=1 Tax=Nocardioides marmorisolisilvae TaxID=1542737 RepID=A0A3N0DXL8_9ACTN|nr:GNAT family N-acetyltransferase [Nocardioides marmorisolisilvae]RNL80246.1 N-acetyltransferase [Nocardioides marmorisolisilvae]
MDQIRLRPLEPDDGALLQEIFDQLGPNSRYQRFLVPKLRLTSYELRVLTAVDHDQHEAVVALALPEERPIGVARFVRGAADPDVAEVAVEVVDSWHRRGIGSLLIRALVARAVDLHVEQLAAVMAHDNLAALRLLHHVPGELGRVPGNQGVAEYRLVLRPDLRPAC